MTSTIVEHSFFRFFLSLQTHDALRRIKVFFRIMSNSVPNPIMLHEIGCLFTSDWKVRDNSGLTEFVPLKVSLHIETYTVFITCKVPVTHWMVTKLYKNPFKSARVRNWRAVYFEKVHSVSNCADVVGGRIRSGTVALHELAYWD